MARNQRIVDAINRALKAGETVKGKPIPTNYKKQLRQFAAWCERNVGKRCSMEEARAAAQRWIDERQQSCKGSTVKVDVAALGCLFGQKMTEYRYDTVSAVSTKGRNSGCIPSVNAARAVAFNKAVGIRCTEVADLRGRDLHTDAAGRLWVTVEKGKGGKRQEQLILPRHEEAVKAAFKGVKPDSYVFTKQERGAMKHANLHADRRAVAQEAYRYYQAMNPARREELKQLVMSRYRETGNMRKWTGWDDKNGKHHTGIAERLDRPYYVRGEVRAAFQAAGLATSYDRLSVIAVSVLQLSHWREDVTVQHYFI